MWLDDALFQRSTLLPLRLPLPHQSRDERCDTTVEGILGGIHVFRCCSAAELVATAKLLAEFVQAHPSVSACLTGGAWVHVCGCSPGVGCCWMGCVQVKLVVLDSVAFHFRHDIQDMASRARILAGLAQTLHELAYRSQLAVGRPPSCTSCARCTRHPSHTCVLHALRSPVAGCRPESSDHAGVRQRAVTAGTRAG